MIALVAVFGFTGCDSDDIPPIGDAGSKLDGINATWDLVQVNVTDETSFPVATRDFTNFYTSASNTPQITFNSADFSYSTAFSGKRNFFGSGGTWAFDDNDYPTMITLNSTDAGTIVVPLTNTIRPTDSRLKIEVQKTCNGSVTSKYLFEFERAN